ncbi:hypothetical protein TNCV_887671 [Trichonephila clavipes]|nr:hypothetical protein TNCV_887671 [Trichonephila clavipes]
MELESIGARYTPDLTVIVQNTPGIHFLRGLSAASSHFGLLHLNPQNNVLSTSFSAMETGAPYHGYGGSHALKLTPNIFGKPNAKYGTPSHFENICGLVMERPGLRGSFRIGGLEGARECGGYGDCFGG